MSKWNINPQKKEVKVSKISMKIQNERRNKKKIFVKCQKFMSCPIFSKWWYL